MSALTASTRQGWLAGPRVPLAITVYIRIERGVEEGGGVRRSGRSVSVKEPWRPQRSTRLKVTPAGDIPNSHRGLGEDLVGESYSRRLAEK
jgi:hypothetical protein